jgi:hypothetical protein
MAEFDDDFQDWAAGFDAEPIGIERHAVRQSRSLLALAQ